MDCGAESAEQIVAVDPAELGTVKKSQVLPLCKGGIQPNGYANCAG